MITATVRGIARIAILATVSLLGAFSLQGCLGGDQGPAAPQQQLQPCYEENLIRGTFFNPYGFDRADVDGDGALDFLEILKLMDTAWPDMPPYCIEVYKWWLANFDGDQDGKFTAAERDKLNDENFQKCKPVFQQNPVMQATFAGSLSADEVLARIDPDGDGTATHDEMTWFSNSVGIDSECAHNIHYVIKQFDMNADWALTKSELEGKRAEL
eukprot:gnl/TRDRNA2_/TRDRNA2_142329_c0_seq1.p1 gnl/TRDRNA2_/TRDRNA2_142329_c0~~gnl/TRDRNA2_/TRDRNA2_142329_c0_seq1.p1  ORF type:complete len:213 (-),score=38.01 gnl/TRDRNA2_/TRDRNA2_142329_c0_seq1:70-708(-)